MNDRLPPLKFDPYFWLTILLSLPIIGPLIQPGYYWGGHDARHSVYFLHQFDKAIQDGLWYPRWSPDFAFGYGYPFFNIYGPLSAYMGELFHFMGLDIVTSVKIVFGLSAILSGMTMYLFVRALLQSPAAGLIAALTYVYLPYHLFDMYVRAALAETVGFIWIPLTLWGFYKAITAPRLAHLAWAAFAYALLMFTSNLLALIFTPILGLYVATMIVWEFLQDPLPQFSESTRQQFGLMSALYYTPNRYWRVIRTGLPPLSVLLLGLGISAVFWMPAFFEYKYVRVDQWIGGRFAFGDDFVELHQLFSPSWGFGASIPGPDDSAGFQIGLAAFVLFIFSLMAVPKLPPQTRRTLYFFQGLSVLIVFLTTPLSYWVWAYLPLSSFAQFPWRLLVVLAPFIAVIAGTIMTVSPPPSPTTLSMPAMMLSSLILLASYPYVQAEVRDPNPTEGPVSQASLFRFQQSSDEMTGQTAWTRHIPNWSTLAEQVERGGEINTKVNYTALPPDDSVGVYSMRQNSIHELLWVGTAESGQTVTFMIPYYPGWRAYIYQDLGPHDGNLDETVGPITRIGPIIEQPTISTTTREGWMVIPIPKGSHFLEIRFEDTIIRVIGRWFSTISLLLWGVIILFDRKFSTQRPAL